MFTNLRANRYYSKMKDHKILIKNVKKAMTEMLYYVYFDRYRHPRIAIPEMELREKYGNDPDAFLEAMEAPGGEEGGNRKVLGHVGVLRVESEGELKDFLETTGEDVVGFYECRSGSRPYNF